MLSYTSHRSTFFARASAALSLSLGVVGACGAEGSPDERPRGNAVEGPQGEAADGPAAAETAINPYHFHPFAPCMSESNYVARGVVRFAFGQAPFTPPCVKLASGGTVVFQGFFEEHPLRPRSLGSWPTPLMSISEGGSVEFEFPDAGFFPYECAKHPDEIGVIWAS